MDSGFLKDFLDLIKIDKGQNAGNITVFPLFFDKENKVDYISLSEALKKGKLIVEEVNKYGQVPELLVVNNSENRVLILEGEELAGAKQNRILNTTILLREKSKTIVPVSCTEQGRWHYKTRHFYHSGYFAFPKLRKKTKTSVHDNLKKNKKHRSNQAEVWKTIREKEKVFCCFSDTGAMRDIYIEKENDFSNIFKKFKLVDKQRGIIVFINGEIVGFDFISRESVFKELFSKLIKSYVFDAMENVSLIEEKKAKNYESEIKEFLKDIKECQIERFPSIGYGEDYRFEIKGISGSMLIYQDEVIHASFIR